MQIYHNYVISLLSAIYYSLVPDVSFVVCDSLCKPYTVVSAHNYFSVKYTGGETKPIPLPKKC